MPIADQPNLSVSLGAKGDAMLQTIPWEEPVFIFTIHRSGGTLLMRMLNCHPALVIWGEHGGFINKLADADLTMRSLRDWLPVRSDEDIEEYVAFPERRQSCFDPLMNPFGYSDFARWCHDLLTQAFSRGLSQGQRWGFKEIRYHRPSVAKFLERLFPAAKFIFLFRDPIELCVSNILVEWSFPQVLAHGGGDDRESLRQVVDDCLYAILANRLALTRFNGRCSRNAFVLDTKLWSNIRKGRWHGCSPSSTFLVKKTFARASAP
jgi:hypothetical protein